MSEDFEIDAWLESLDLGQYGELFRQQGVTPALLPSLTDEDLRAIGIEAFGHRKTLLLAIKNMGETLPARTEPEQETALAHAFFPLPSETVLPPSAAFFPLPQTISEIASVLAPQDVIEATTPKRWSWKRFGGKFLIVSIALHILLGIGATVFVVQTIQAKRKVTFQAGPKSPNPSTRAIEHKVSMVKKQNTMSAPAQMKRITANTASKISLPAMPAMPKMDDFTPTQMAGMGGTGVGPSFGGAGGAGGGTGGSGMTLFGFRNSSAGGLPGYLYDLKQTREGQPSGLDIPGYAPVVAGFVKGGFKEDTLDKYFKAPQPLYAGQLFTPDMSADEAPKAFGVEKQVAPKLWIVVYKGQVVAPESGSYRFVGIADDIMVVKFKDRIVLDWGSYPISAWRPKKKYMYDLSWLLPKATEWYKITGGHAVGDEFLVEGGRSYDIEILIGEQPGGYFTTQLLIEKIGVKYEKDAGGNPILPVFRMAKTPNPDGKLLPPFLPDGPIWKGSAKKTFLGR